VTAGAIDSILEIYGIEVTLMSVSLFWNSNVDLNLEFLCHDDIVIDSEGI